VELITGAPATEIGADFVILGNRRIAARTLLWAAGVAGSPLGKLLGAELDRAGRVRVRTDLSLASHPEVFVAGDLASIDQDGAPVPGVAQAAKQMGSRAANNILARIDGRETKPFHYTDLGALATIGRHSAIAQLPGIKFSGLLAWWFWVALHIYFLIGFRSRIIVIINWAWAYFTHSRGARIILGNETGKETHGHQEKNTVQGN
jgi:NADH dehydrogenase